MAILVFNGLDHIDWKLCLAWNSVLQYIKNNITLAELKIKLKELGSINCNFLLRQLKRKVLNLLHTYLVQKIYLLVPRSP